MLIIFLYKILQKYNSEMMESFLHLSIPAHYIRLVFELFAIILQLLSFIYCIGSSYPDNLWLHCKVSS